MTVLTRINACGRVTLRQTLVALSCGVALVMPLVVPNGLMFDGLLSCAAAQEQDVPIAELKGKLQRETQGLERHIAELVEKGRDDEAEATRQELAKFQQAMEQQIREVRSKRSTESDQKARQERARQERAESGQKRRAEHQEKREHQENREAMEREARTHRHESAPDPEQHVRELHEQLTQAIKQRQPERVLELSHLIANHLREQSRHERRQRERTEQDRPRDERPRDERPRHDGPGPEVADEIRMMVQELRDQVQQLRHELEELRRERR